MIHLPSHCRVFLALGSTDMRKSINALSILVEAVLELDPFSGHLFVFSNRRHTMLKVLYWDRNGFCLFLKRLEKHHFKWPHSKGSAPGNWAFYFKDWTSAPYTPMGH